MGGREMKEVDKAQRRRGRQHKDITTQVSMKLYEAKSCSLWLFWILKRKDHTKGKIKKTYNK